MGVFSWLFRKKKRKKRRVVRGGKPRSAMQQRRGVPPRPARPVRSLAEVAPSVPSLDYFEMPRPDGDGVCNDEECGCKGVVIPRGSGYLYVSQEVVDFRRDARSVEAAQAKESRVRMQASDMAEAAAVIHGETTAVLLCDQAARQKGLDLEVAAADARHWWETGGAPLRATPITEVVEVRPEEEIAAAPAAEEPEEKPKKPGAKKSTKKPAKKSVKKPTKSTRRKKAEEEAEEAED
jgi:hypothetical protein